MFKEGLQMRKEKDIERRTPAGVPITPIAPRRDADRTGAPWEKPGQPQRQRPGKGTEEEPIFIGTPDKEAVPELA